MYLDCFRLAAVAARQDFPMLPINNLQTNKRDGGKTALVTSRQADLVHVGQ